MHEMCWINLHKLLSFVTDVEKLDKLQTPNLGPSRS